MEYIRDAIPSGALETNAAMIESWLKSIVNHRPSQISLLKEEYQGTDARYH